MLPTNYATYVLIMCPMRLRAATFMLVCMPNHMFPAPCCTQVVIPLLQVLEQLHSMHIVHRDIKPENLLFDAAGTLLVGDFGLAVNQLTERPCLRMGTLDYMCPEVSAAGSTAATAVLSRRCVQQHTAACSWHCRARANLYHVHLCPHRPLLHPGNCAIPTERVPATSHPNHATCCTPQVLSQPSAEEAEARRLLTCELPTYSEKVDIWSVGVLVFELLSGKTPFEVDDISQTASNIMHNRRAPFPAGMSQECQQFVQAALTRDISSRPSAQQLLAQPWVQQHMLGVDCYAVVTLEKARLGKEQQQVGGSVAGCTVLTPAAARPLDCTSAGQQQQH
jgi:serine/threonine protein kinase